MNLAHDGRGGDRSSLYREAGAHVVAGRGEESIRSVPSSSSTRSRIPSRPKPVVSAAGSKPAPSSRTSTCTVAVLVNLNDRTLRAAVLGGVGERLLDDPVECGLELRDVAGRCPVACDRTAALLVREARC